MAAMHTISILFSKQNDRVSNGLYWITGRKYTHVSLRLDEMGEEFYSFNIKGFCTETPRFFNHVRTERSVLYQFQVNDDAYQIMSANILAFQAERQQYRYAGLGVALCLAHIPHRFQHAYFCSQFVAELLRGSGALPLRRRPSVCLPNALERELWAYKAAEQAIPDPYRDLPSSERNEPVRRPGLFTQIGAFWKRMLLPV